MKPILCILSFFFSITLVKGQTEVPQTEVSVDSLRFKRIQEQLDGCWRTRYGQFKYLSETNSGGDYLSKTHSSAPVFLLTMKGDDVFIEWLELTGGSNLIKIQRIKKNKLIVRNEDGMKITYRRNRKCQST